MGSMSVASKEQKWTANEVRQQFVDFFVNGGSGTKSEVLRHKFWPSSSVVPHGDPTLLFINAGMNQFKPIFLGDVPPGSPFVGLQRAVNSQKCIRAGGKHNDLEDVGKDVYHHTFFEMLGNWSFGDYFKKEAIDLSWALLTEVWKLDPNRLYVTYFSGDAKSGVEPDHEARMLWEQKLPKNRVLPFGAKENFWEMGDVGPCGPCSEIHYDRIEGRTDAAQLVNQDDPDVLEIWNLVFMQFNREKDGKLTPLPKKSVDTGMGLERVLSILQNKSSNYDTDLFQPLFQAIHDLVEDPNALPHYQGKIGTDDPERRDMAYRVVADHVRTLTIAISDGAAPSAEGRGYVVRRILRRAVRFGRQILGAPKDKPWLSQLVPLAAELLGDGYPELREKAQFVQRVVASEEIQFAKTLDKGVALFKRSCSKLRPEEKIFPGKEAFELYSTYGFPLDLTELMAEEAGLKIDNEGFESALAAHQAANKATTFKDTAALGLTPDAVDELEKRMRLPPTDDKPKYEWTSRNGTGKSVDAVLKAIWTGSEFLLHLQAQPEAEPKNIALIFDRTNFYAESGGQVADTGAITFANGLQFTVTDTRKQGNWVLHCGTFSQSSADNCRILSPEAPAVLQPCFARRAQTAKNHTGTHVLNYALRKVIGESCDQRGSLVDPSKLRFDFTSEAALTDVQITEVEKTVGEIIARTAKVDAREVPLCDAKKIPGLRACFGEVYPDPVRVVSVGASVDDLLSGKLSGNEVSVEFCGGTHLADASEIEAFVVVTEEPIARGIRRLVGCTGQAAVKCKQEAAALLTRAAGIKASNAEAEIAYLRGQLKDKREQLPLLERKKILGLLDEATKNRAEELRTKAKVLKKIAEDLAVAESQKEHDGCTSPRVYCFPELEADFKAMEGFLNLFQKSKAGVSVCIVSTNESTTAVLAGGPKDGINCGQWVAAAVAPLGGKGGGKPTTARGTAPSSGADVATKAAEAFLRSV